MLRTEGTGRHTSGFDERWLHLLDAAATVFATEGFHRASMRQIASAADLSLAGIYHYVAGKEELLYWIQYRTFDSLLKNLERTLRGIEDPRQRLGVAVRNHVRHFGENMHELKVCARELEALEGDAYQAVHDRRRAYFEAFHRLIRELPARPPASLDPWLATANLFGMLNWFYQWYDPKRSRGLDDLAAQQTALFLQGYAAPATREDVRGVE